MVFFIEESAKNRVSSLSSIYGWKGRFFFVTLREPWGIEVVWRTPLMDLNNLVGLGQKEAENLDHLLECPCSAFELLEEEALVNADLNPMELRGNFLWTLI